MNKIFIGIFIITIIYYIYNHKLTEKFHNMIDNGNFNNGLLSSNSNGSFIGNSIINMVNPGKTSYVLKQSDINTVNHKTRYQLNIDVKSNIYYKLSCWVAYSNNWDGNHNLFNIVYHNKNGESNVETYIGELDNRKKIEGLLWEKIFTIFKVPETSNGKIELYIGYNPSNKNGNRYITSLELNQYFPLISDFEITDSVITFLSTYHTNSFAEKSNIWKDLSMNGNDFKFTSEISVDNKKILLNENKIIGPPSNILIPDENNFTIAWSCLFSNFSSGEFLQFYANNDYNIGIKIEYNNDLGINNNITIKLENKTIEYALGLTHKHMTYILVKKDSYIEFYQDGYKLNSTLLINNLDGRYEYGDKNRYIGELPLSNEFKEDDEACKKLCFSQPECKNLTNKDTNKDINKGTNINDKDTNINDKDTNINETDTNNINPNIKKTDDYLLKCHYKLFSQDEKCYCSVPIAPVDNSIKTLELNSKNLTINTNKSIEGSIDFFIIFNKSLNHDDVNYLNNYLTKYRVNNKFSKYPIINNNYSKANICPFRTDIFNSPCYLPECCSSDWKNMNISEQCKDKINYYCKHNNDSICSNLRSIKLGKGCSNSKSIFKSLNLLENHENDFKKKCADLNISKKQTVGISASQSDISKKQTVGTSDSRSDISQSKIAQVHTSDITTSEQHIINKATDNVSKGIYAQKCNLDLNKYIRKDKIPCWGCNLSASNINY